MLQGRFHIVYMVYRDIMAASIGPNKFIFPRNLDELDDVSSRYRSVPLPPSLWSKSSLVWSDPISEGKFLLIGLLSYISDGLPDDG